MKKLLFIIPLLLFSCKTVEYKYVPVKETRTEEVILRDTIIEIQLQIIKDSVSVRDTVSFLENQYAYSKVVFSLGRLNHSLGIKNVKIPTEIQLVEKIICDSIPYPVEVTHTVVEEKKGFFWWSGIALYLVLLMIGIFKLSRFFFII